MSKTAEYWIQKLDLVQLPEEGGMYREVYRSDVVLSRESLPDHYLGDRCSATDIYYLLQGKTFSAFHCVASDEIWHFLAGNTMLVHVIDHSGNYRVEKLGTDLDKGENLRILMPRGTWFAAQMQDQSPENYALVSCVVTPGFEFADFELGVRDELLQQYPCHENVIRKMTRG